MFLLAPENPCNNEAPILKESPINDPDRDTFLLSLKSSFEFIAIYFFHCLCKISINLKVYYYKMQFLKKNWNFIIVLLIKIKHKNARNCWAESKRKAEKVQWKTLNDDEKQKSWQNKTYSTTEKIIRRTFQKGNYNEWRKTPSLTLKKGRALIRILLRKKWLKEWWW